MSKEAIEMLHDLDEGEEAWAGDGHEEHEGAEESVADEEPPHEEEEKQEPQAADEDVRKGQIKVALIEARQKRREERDARIAAEERLRELQAKIDAANSSEEEDEELSFTDQDMEDMEALKPGFKGYIEKMKKKTETLALKRAKAEEIAREVYDERVRELGAQALAVARTIPELAYWEAEEPDVFAEAQKIDGAFLKSGAYEGVDMRDRFEDVVKQVKRRLGKKADLPALTDLNKDEPWAILLEDSEPKKEDKVEKKQTPKGKPKVSTLDDIGGGGMKKDINIDALDPTELEELAAKAGSYDAMLDIVSRARAR